MLKTVWYFLRPTFYFSDSLKNKKQRLFEIETFCNIINVFTVTFNQYNVSLCHNVSFNNNWNIFFLYLTVDLIFLNTFYFNIN